MKNEEGRRQKAAGTTRHRASRFTFHVSRPPAAFTLIELLVVIAIIAILAALTFPAATAVKISMLRARAKSELIQLETAIERYKDKLGYYPPDNKVAAGGSPNWDTPGNSAVPSYALNQLYYELLGTTNVTIAGVPYYQTLDGSAQIKVADVPNVAGPNVTRFMNCARPASGDEAPSGTAFLGGLKPAQFLEVANPAPHTVLGSALDGPVTYSGAQGATINPWRYNSSNPRYNPKSFDLWIDLHVGDKTNRICNWSDKPLVVSAPY